MFTRLGENLKSHLRVGMECKEQNNNKGPLVYRYKPVSMANEGVTPPFLGEVDVSDKF